MVVLACSPVSSLAYPSHWDHTIAKEARFDVDAEGGLDIDVPDADVVVQPGTDGVVTVQLEVASADLDRAMEAYEDMGFRIDGTRNTVAVKARSQRSGWRWRHSAYTVTVRVTLPENFNINVETDDGDIQVTSVTGNLQLRTSDGDIRIDKVRCQRLLLDSSDGDIILGEVHAPDVQIETSDGGIEAEELFGVDIDIRTSDGDISIEALAGGLNAVTTDGDIRVHITELQPTTLRTGDGDITLITDSGLNANLDLSGDDLVLREADLNFQGELSEHRARGKLNGGGPRLQASTRDGSITFSTRNAASVTRE
jgi:hypothetical protein